MLHETGCLAKLQQQAVKMDDVEAGAVHSAFCELNWFLQFFSRR